jgi:hypothetical protein
MSIHRKRASIALLLGALFLAPLPPGADPGVAHALEIGEKAPDFTLPSTTGGPISLGQFRGKKLVLLEFYAADFAPV